MRLEAVLTRDDLHGILNQFAPLEIRLGKNGNLLLDSPSKVALIPGEGLSIVCHATLHWPVLGVSVPVSMRGLTVEVRPAVRPGLAGGGDVVAFTLQIDRAGVTVLPEVIDDKVTSRVNQELVEKHVELSWNFAKSLSHVFELPDALASAAALKLKVRQGIVVVTESAVVFTVDFGAEVQRASGLLERRLT